MHAWVNFPFQNGMRFRETVLKSLKLLLEKLPDNSLTEIVIETVIVTATDTVVDKLGISI